MIHREKNIKEKAALDIAEKMLAASITAPKGKGKNTLESIIISGKELFTIADEMDKISEIYNASIFKRDANNIRKSNAALVIGSTIESLGIQELCTYCGFKNCVEKDKHSDVPCNFNTVDLGIALGSAAAIANQFHADNRIMFTLGKAAISKSLFEKNIKIAYGIPISISQKNIFFDR